MKKLLLSLLLPSLLLAYQPASPPAVQLRPPPVLLLTQPPDLQPTQVVAIIPAVVIGGAILFGVARGGIWIWSKALGAWEHHLTNSPPQGIGWQFTGEEYPE